MAVGSHDSQLGYLPADDGLAAVVIERRTGPMLAR